MFVVMLMPCAAPLCRLDGAYALWPIIPARPMRYVITGGAGFLGINLCRYLLERVATVRTLDIASFSYPERSAVEVLDGDVHANAVDRATYDVDIHHACRRGATGTATAKRSTRGRPMERVRRAFTPW